MAVMLWHIIAIIIMCITQFWFQPITAAWLLPQTSSKVHLVQFRMDLCNIAEYSIVVLGTRTHVHIYLHVTTKVSNLCVYVCVLHVHDM